MLRQNWLDFIFCMQYSGISHILHEQFKLLLRMTFEQFKMFISNAERQQS